MKYVVGTGWYSEHALGYANRRGHMYPSSPAFHEHVWLPLLHKYALPKPEAVLVTDSAAPIRPAQADSEQWIRLNANYGFGGAYNGWLRGFLMGAWYAWLCDCDYIYVEQDAVVLGAGWPKILSSTANGARVLVGETRRPGCKPLPWALQQSLVFVPHALIEEFAHGVVSAPQSCCETRFANAKVPLGHIPFGYGRHRPINFKDPMLYAQHWSGAELLLLAEREGIPAIKTDLEAYSAS